MVLFCLAMVSFAKAQKFKPEIKEGTVFNCAANVNGQEFPLVLTVKNLTDPIAIAWSVEGYGDGTFEISKTSLATATKLAVVTQPATGTTKVTEGETFGFISQSAFKDLKDKGEFVYSDLKFKLVNPDDKPFKLGDQEVDALHAISEDKKVDVWVLNDSKMPLLLQTIGASTDITIKEIK